MALHIDHEWTLALIHFLKSLTNETTAAGRLLAEQKRVTRLTRGLDPERLGGHLAAEQGPRRKTWLYLESGAVRAECECLGPHPCPHGAALALTVLGEAFRRGSAYRKAIEPKLPSAWRQGATGIHPDAFQSLQALFEPERSPSPVEVANSPIGGGKPEEIDALRNEGPPILLEMSLTASPEGQFATPLWRLILRRPKQPARACTAREMKQLLRQLKGQPFFAKLISSLL